MDEIELEGRHAALLEALSAFDRASEKDASRALDEREYDATHYRFQAAILPEPLPQSRLTGVRVEHRGRLEGWGLADDLIIHCSRRDAWNVGLWLVASVLHAPDFEPVLDLADGAERIRRIRLEREQPSFRPFAVKIESYDWRPAEPEEWLRRDPTQRFLGQRAQLQLLNSDEFDFAPGSFDRRDELQLSGADPALLMLAEFLLNFGCSHSDLNYEYLNQLLDEFSCDARIQLPDIVRHSRL
jgi:hypothetical protein